MNSEPNRLAHFSPAKRALLAAKLEAKRAAAAKWEIQRQPEQVSPLCSSAQTRLWLLDRLAPERSLSPPELSPHIRTAAYLFSRIMSPRTPPPA